MLPNSHMECVHVCGGYKREWVCICVSCLTKCTNLVTCIVSSMLLLSCFAVKSTIPMLSYKQTQCVTHFIKWQHIFNLNHIWNTMHASPQLASRHQFLPHTLSLSLYLFVSHCYSIWTYMCGAIVRSLLDSHFRHFNSIKLWMVSPIFMKRLSRSRWHIMKYLLIIFGTFWEFAGRCVYFKFYDRHTVRCSLFWTDFFADTVKRQISAFHKLNEMKHTLARTHQTPLPTSPSHLFLFLNIVPCKSFDVVQ